MRGKILITGSDGQLGRELTAHFSVDYDVISADIQQFDIRDPNATMKHITEASVSHPLHMTLM
jgi:dTDP-4-dehydrorhamnose reductase